MPRTKPLEVEPWTYRQRCAYVELVIKRFKEDLNLLLKHFHEQDPTGHDHFDMGLDVYPGDNWVVRWDFKKKKIVRLWTNEPIERKNEEETWMEMSITVPKYKDPYLSTSRSKEKQPAA